MAAAAGSVSSGTHLKTFFLPVCWRWRSVHPHHQPSLNIWERPSLRSRSLHRWNRPQPIGWHGRTWNRMWWHIISWHGITDMESCDMMHSMVSHTMTWCSVLWCCCDEVREPGGVRALTWYITTTWKLWHSIQLLILWTSCGVLPLGDSLPVLQPRSSVPQAGQ